MKFAVYVLTAFIVMTSAAGAVERQRHVSTQSTCDNDGRCTTSNASGPAPSLRKTGHARVASAAAVEHRATVVDANGNAPGIIVSSKTGARAHVGATYAARFQAYINDLENNYGARVLFMGGIRPGRCSVYSEHPCGKALDVCQLRRGVVDRRCQLPGRATLGQIAASHGLFEGGRWCDSDYGHAQVGVTAPACGESRIVRQ
jgi:hypothetical protein